MAIPGSGPLFLRATINQEYNGNDTDTNVSLGALSDLAGLDVPPDAMSEFYGTSSFTAPTISSNISSNSVSSSGMTITFAYSNPSAANLNHAYYFGTNSNRTSNPLYSGGTSTSTNNTVSRNFTGLTAGATYYYWGVVWDTESPERFSQLITNGSRTTPLPANTLTFTKNTCTGGGLNDCTTLQASTYSSLNNLYFDGSYNISGPYNQSPSSTARVYGAWSTGTHIDNTRTVNGPGSFSASGSFYYGPCYCGWTTVYWSFTRSGYSSQSGEWCRIGASTTLPAYLYNTC